MVRYIKKNNGFTLIKLLVIVILTGIIIFVAIKLIAIKNVLNVVDKAKGDAIVNTAYSVADSAKLAYIESLLDETPITGGSATTLSAVSEKPTGGTWTVDTTETGTGAKVSIKDVTFASMPDYFCNTVDANGTIKCEKRK